MEMTYTCITCGHPGERGRAGVHVCQPMRPAMAAALEAMTLAAARDIETTASIIVRKTSSVGFTEAEALKRMAEAGKAGSRAGAEYRRLADIQKQIK